MSVVEQIGWRPAASLRGSQSWCRENASYQTSRRGCPVCSVSDETRYDSKAKTVDFLHPEELRTALPLAIGRQGCGEEELQKISEAVVKYSVKTCHPHFYNQLYHRADEYGLAGSWLSDALNTNIHTFEVSPQSMLQLPRWPPPSSS